MNPAVTPPRRRARRLLAGILAGALALSASPLLGGVAGAADDLPPLADPLANGAFCDGAPGDNPFSDLGSESPTTREAILCLVATELTQGLTRTTYAPGASVTRRQMALFIKRLADLFDELSTGEPALATLPAYDGTPGYSDVTASDPGAEAIGQLSQADIVGGFPGGQFRPNDLVSRRQMAAFINRLQDFLVGAPFTVTGDYFDDDEGDSGEGNLNAVASVGIFQGDGAGNVDPGGDITRRQMANVILRDAQVHLGFGSIEAPFEPAGNETLAITPKTGTGLTVVAGTPETPADTSDDRTYTVTGLDADTDYRVTLVEAANITRTEGRAVFAEDGTSGLADSGTVLARITNANGAPAGGAAQSVGGISPIDGKVTFVVDGQAVEEVTPVIYVDGGASTQLELDDEGEPIEAFGVGGTIAYSALTAPTIAEGLAGISDITNTTATVHVGGVTPGASVQVFVIPGANAPYDLDATPKVDTATDAEPFTAGFQVPISGLTPYTVYTVYATQTVGEDRSPQSTPGRPLTTEQEPVIITATADANDAGDAVIVTFASPVVCGNGAAVDASRVTGALLPIPNAFDGCAQGASPNILVYSLSSTLLLPGSYTAELVTGAALSNAGTKPPVLGFTAPFTF